MLILDPKDTSHLDELLLDNGRLRVVPAATYDHIPHEDLMLWCHRHAFYGLPTTELVDFLKQEVGDRKVIEIGAGNGALGRALGIPMTDSYIQEAGRTALGDAVYDGMRQPRVKYGSDVEELEAMGAVRKYKPQVVIGCWVTQRVPANRLTAQGSVYGVNEERLLERVEAYIVVGNLGVHGKKEIMRHEHAIIQAPWIKSRSRNPEDNCILIWRGGRR